jgi:hypothetical protein
MARCTEGRAWRASGGWREDYAGYGWSCWRVVDHRDAREEEERRQHVDSGKHRLVRSDWSINECTFIQC